MTKLQRVDLDDGPIVYEDVGSGPVIVFVHGILVSGQHWRKVVPRLSDRYRCVVPTLPLGAHTEAMAADADLTFPGLARIVARFLDALGLEDVTLVGNDTGGVICQLVATNHPRSIERLVLTNCDAFEHFLPITFRYLQWGAHLPGFLWTTAQTMRLRVARTLPIAFGGLVKHGVDHEAVDEYLRPLQEDARVRRDAAKVLRSISSRVSVEAASRFGEFPKPVLLAWAPEDPHFPRADAERMASLFPNAEIVEIPDSRAFVPEDRPDLLAETIGAFVRPLTERASAESA